MLFDVMGDEGVRIGLYIVPDAGGSIPSIRINGGGTELLVLAANTTIREFVTAGRHATGTCGFTIDESLVPGLAAYADLEIIEADTGLIIYRRANPDMIQDMTIFRMETHLMPLWRIDDAMKMRFRYWYKAIDRYGRETSTQVFCLRNGNSCYVSGRLLFKNYEFYLSKGIKSIAMVRDPYNELAERLILLKKVGPYAEDILGARDAMTYAPVMETLEEFDHLDETFCKRFFKRAGDLEFTALANPLVRQLTAQVPDEMPKQSSVSTALDALSSFEVVGLRSNGPEFCRAVVETLGLPETAIPPIAEESSSVMDLGDRLRACHAAETFLEKDLEVFHFISAAFTEAEGAV